MEQGLIGFGIGVLGTLVGAGGGFLAVPILILGFGFPPAQAAGTSLVMVWCNATAGSLAYARQRKIDYAAGTVFALATYPGAMLGAQATALLGSRNFKVAFGLLLAAVAVSMLLRPPPEHGGGRSARRGGAAGAGVKQAGGLADMLGWQPVTRVLADADGVVHRWTYRPLTGIAISVAVGFISSLLGIGGGIIHVPALVYLLGYPAHLATATSHFVLAWSALVGVVVHFLEGNVQWAPGLALGIGAAAGAPLGAWLAQRTRARQILRALAVALLGVAARLTLGR